MLTLKKYQNEIYSLALSLVYDSGKAKKAAVKAFEKMPSLDEDSPEIKLRLFKNLLSGINAFSIKKKKNSCGDFVSLAKKRMPLFDKKVFVLKYEHCFTVKDICCVLAKDAEKVKISMLKSSKIISDYLEAQKNEM